MKSMIPGKEPITSFSGEFAFLSNFSYNSVVFENQIFPTSEHAFQAAKTLDPAERDMIQKAYSPGKAKRLGRLVSLRKDWESVKFAVMETCLRSKFRDKALMKQLKETKGRMLVEGNTWGDRIWGVCEGKGENHLGKLLMKIRDEEK